MALNYKGCDVCRNEIWRLHFDVVELVQADRVPLLGVYRCQNCGQWYEWDFSGRIYDRSAEQATVAIARLEKDGQ